MFEIKLNGIQKSILKKKTKKNIRFSWKILKACKDTQVFQT